jgi:hypothetical protein
MSGFFSFSKNIFHIRSTDHSGARDRKTNDVTKRHVCGVAFHDFYYSGISAFTALLKVQSDIFQSLDKGDVTVLAMLDLSAAFDTIDHQILLHRFEHLFRITGPALYSGLLPTLVITIPYCRDRWETACATSVIQIWRPPGFRVGSQDVHYVHKTTGGCHSGP